MLKTNHIKKINENKDKLYLIPFSSLHKKFIRFKKKLYVQLG